MKRVSIAGVLRGLDRAGADHVGHGPLGAGDRAAPRRRPAASAAAARRVRAATADKQKPKPKRWKAYKGAFFNNPHVNADRFKIERRIIDTIRHTPKGETIRIAVYSFDRMPVADALIAAHKRGVKIQMLLNDHQDTHAMKRVRAVLGTNRFAKNFIYKCKQGCRTIADQYRNLHSKFYLSPRPASPRTCWSSARST